MKKFLALVLAMMMTFSLMVTVNAAATSDFTDADAITDEFSEAVAVLEGLGVFKGYTNGDKFDFRPQNNITRAEVATIVYRLATGDATDKQAYLYEGGAKKFKDVPDDHWASGAIGYCANNLLVRGYDEVRFGPNDYVTGVQAITMILRAVGYGQGGEFEGWGWETRAYGRARAEGLLVNVDKSNYSGKLTEVATRELVAELLFQASLIPQVTWTEALGYNKYTTLSGSTLNADLAWENFQLNVSNYTVVDKWGRPGYYWVTGNTVEADLSNVVATIKADPVKTYDTAVKECDVAHDLEFDGSRTYALYVNRNTPITSQYRIEATDTVTRVGGQGRITEFYATKAHPWSNRGGFTARTGWTQSVVMIDTYLATVTRVTERVLDPQGHEIYPSYLYLDVHDGQTVGVADKTDAYESTAKDTTNYPNGDTVKRNTSEHIASKKGANWEYAVGDKVLVQGYTDYTQNDAAIDITTGKAPTGGATGLDNGSGLNHELDVTARNKAAFETNILGADDTKINVVQKADYKTGKQTVTTWNTGKHTMDGTDYNDQMTLFLDVAGTTTNTTYAWYFDTKGNLIGIDNVPNTVNYGVITSIWTSFNQGETNTDGTAKTFAKVLYADGTEATISIDKFLMGGAQAGSTDIAAVTAGTEMQKAANTIELTPVYDYGDTTRGNTMKAGTAGAATANAAAKADLYVAPVASVNTGVENWTAQTSGGYFGIIKGNLFKFEASADGNMTAIEVGGKDVAGNANDGKYVGHYNYGAAATAISFLYKNLAYISVDNGVNRIAWLDSETKIMVNDGTDSQNVKCYTMSTLPGNVAIDANSEIDWADTDGDGRAEYVYVTGTIQGSVTYGLFYYNGGAAQWNGVEKKGTAFGWLNGDPTTVNFDDEDEFNAVRNSQGYAGHLFAFQMTNGVVSNVMGVDQTGTPDYYLLVPTAGTAITIGATDKVNTTDGNLDYLANAATPVAGISFKLGSNDSKNGNPYTANTEAVYLKDVTGTPAGTDVNLSYDPATRTIIDKTNSKTYYLTPGSKVIGLGMGVNQESAILDYLNKSTTNDVTIVYEQSNVKSIVEIYVATDPNVTPGDTVNLGFGAGVQAATGTFADDAALLAYLKNFSTGVFSCSTQKLASSRPASELLYFPFNSNNGTASPATLTISNASGNTVYSETAPSVNAGAHVFYIDYTGAATVGAWIGTKGLTAGTYSYSITMAGQVLSSGTFQMVLS